MNIKRTYRRVAGIAAIWGWLILSQGASATPPASETPDMRAAQSTPTNNVTIVLAAQETPPPASSTNNYQSWAG